MKPEPDQPDEQDRSDQSDQSDQPEDRAEQRPGEDPHEDPHEDGGLELARSIARGLAGRTPKRAPRRTAAGEGEWRARRAGSARPSGAHPDERDPQTLDDTMARLVGERGWETELRVHGVFSRWEAIVGQEVGQHARPESFADGRLVCRAESTAWATQLRLLAPALVRRLNEVLGDGTVTVIDVVGPRAPSWSKGRFRVKGRGPRDTYG